MLNIDFECRLYSLTSKYLIQFDYFYLCYFFYQKPRGLTMFYLETRKDDGSLNNIEIVKLKDKLGKS